MAIERIGTFFKTHLTTDYPSVCNTLTNLAFAPLQHLIGQKNYRSLNGRVYDLSTAPPQAPATLLRSVWKAIICIAAFFLAIPLTPCGILTRHLSFFSKDINTNYWTIRLLPLYPSDRSKLLSKFDSSLQAAIRKQLPALEKQMEFDAHLTSAIACLKELNRQLQRKDKAAATLLNEASKKSTYPFPFQLAENLKTVELRQIPNPDLLAQFEPLHQSCQKQLEAVQLVLIDAAVNIRIANRVIKAANQNNRFFIALNEKFEDLAIETSVIAAELIAKKKTVDYCFPFYTQPLLLDLMKIIDPDQHKLLEANYSSCMKFVKPNPGILSLSDENPPEHHSSLLVIEQMKNISRLESMYQKLLKTT